MQPAAALLLALLLLPALGHPIVPRAIQRYGALHRPVWGDQYDSGSDVTDNRISSDTAREDAVVFDPAAAAAAAERDRKIADILEQPLESLLDQEVVSRLEALSEPQLDEVLRAPARLLVATPADVRQALDRPVYETLGLRAAHVLGRLPGRVQAALASLLQLPLRDVLRRGPGLEPLYRSFINTPDRLVTCPPGQGKASDGSCRDKWK